MTMIKKPKIVLDRPDLTKEADNSNFVLLFVQLIM